jgi:hypothetical protein
MEILRRKLKNQLLEDFEESVLCLFDYLRRRTKMTRKKILYFAGNQVLNPLF